MYFIHRLAAALLLLVCALPGAALADTGACGARFIEPAVSSYSASSADSGTLISSGNATGPAAGWAAASLPVSLPQMSAITSPWTMCGATDTNKAIVFKAPLLAAPAAPSLTSTNGGVLGSRTEFYKLTFVNLAGETVASTESSLALGASTLAVVGAPSVPGGSNATGYDVYASTSSGAEQKQNSSPIALASNWTEPTGGLIAGSAPPSTGIAPSAYIIDGGQTLASYIVGTSNFQTATLTADGTNFRVVSTSLESRRINGATASLPSRWVYPGGPGYAATQGDNGNVVSSGGASGTLTVTLPSTTAIAAGWTTAFKAEGGNPLTLAVNGTAGGKILVPTVVAGISTTTLQPTYSETLQFDGANFQVIGTSLGSAPGAIIMQPPSTGCPSGAATPWTFTTPDGSAVPNLSTTASNGYNEAEAYAYVNGWSLIVYGMGGEIGTAPSGNFACRMIASSAAGFVQKPIANRAVHWYGVFAQCSASANLGCLNLDSLVEGEFIAEGSQIASAPTTCVAGTTAATGQGSNGTAAILIKPATLLPVENFKGVANSRVSLPSASVNCQSGTGDAVLAFDLTNGTIGASHVSIPEVNGEGPAAGPISVNYDIVARNAQSGSALQDLTIHVDGEIHFALLAGIRIGGTTTQSNYRVIKVEAGTDEPATSAAVAIDNYAPYSNFAIGEVSNNEGPFKTVVKTEAGATGNFYHFDFASGQGDASPGITDLANWQNTYYIGAQGGIINAYKGGRVVNWLAQSSGNLSCGTGATFEAGSTNARGVISIGSGSPTTCAMTYQGITFAAPLPNCIGIFSTGGSLATLIISNRTSTLSQFTASRAMSAGEQIAYTCE